MYYDFTYLYNEEYSRHIIHHEFFHFLDHMINGTMYYRDKVWEGFNESEFKYHGSGVTAYTNAKGVYSLTFPEKGFINYYSTYSSIEDRAEIYGSLFIKRKKDIILQRAAKDSILQKKIEYMEAYIKKHSLLKHVF